MLQQIRPLNTRNVFSDPSVDKARAHWFAADAIPAGNGQEGRA